MQKIFISSLRNIKQATGTFSNMTANTKNLKIARQRCSKDV